ncbi:MAG TPA: hypothetical protein VFP72_21235 [Kineosporiaceae bacterium]|nr:hypothetical protein [Kineosporiaceae bacterium]
MADRRWGGCLRLVVKVVAAVLAIVVLALVGLGYLYDREVHREAVDSMEYLRTRVHGVVRESLKEDPQARSAALTATLRRHLNREGGVHVLQASEHGPDRMELLVSLLDKQSMNAFIGYDWVACLRVDVTAGDISTVTSTDLTCPADAVFTDIPQEDRPTWPLQPGVPDGAEVFHLPLLREQL